MFVYTQFLCDNIRLSRVTNVSPDTDVAVISLYESVTNLTFLHSYMQYNMVRDWCQKRSEIYTPINLLASELG